MWLLKYRFIFLFMILISTSLLKVTCKQKAETILISDAQNGRQFVLSENSKEKKIVIRNNYKPCEKTDRMSGIDQDKQSSEQQEIKTVKPSSASVLLSTSSTSRPQEIPATISYHLPDAISDRNSAFSSAGASKSTKNKKSKHKSKENKEKQNDKVTNTIVPQAYSNFAIPMDPMSSILKSTLSVNQLGYSYPVYIPENPLADFVKQRLTAQRLISNPIEHPIIYQIQESNDYPAFLSQFNAVAAGQTTPATYQLKAHQFGYPDHMSTHMGAMPMNNNAFLHDYAYINAYQSQLLNHQYQQAQQAQLINHLIPQLIQSTLTKKPINIIAAPAPMNYGAMPLSTYKFVNFQDPSSTVLDTGGLLTKQISSMLNKGLVYPYVTGSGQVNGNRPYTASSKSTGNKKKNSDTKKDYRPFLSNDYYESGFNNFNSLSNKDFLKDYGLSGAYGKDSYHSSKEYQKDFVKDYQKDYSKDFVKDYQKDYTKDFFKDYQKDYSKDSVKDYQKDYPNSYPQNYLANKVNRTEPYFRLPIFRKSSEDKAEDARAIIKYPLFSLKDESADFFSPFSEPIIKKEDNSDSFKPIIPYSKMINENTSPFIKRNASASLFDQIDAQFGLTNNQINNQVSNQINSQMSNQINNRINNQGNNQKIAPTNSHQGNQQGNQMSQIEQFRNQINSKLNTPFNGHLGNQIDSGSIDPFTSIEFKDFDTFPNSSEFFSKPIISSKQVNSTMAGEDNSLEFDY